MSTFDNTNSNAVLEQFLSSEANHIDKQVWQEGRYTSPWVELVPRGTFESGSSSVRNSLIYKESLPKYESNPGVSGYDTVGVQFSPLADSAEAATDRATGVIQEALEDGTGSTYNDSRVDFKKVLRDYGLDQTALFSPFLDLDILRVTTNLAEQLDAIKSILGRVVSWTWDERTRDEYNAACDNVVACLAANTAVTTGQTGLAISSFNVDPGADDSNTLLPTANLSEAVLDLVYYRLQIQGASQGAYDYDAGAPIYGLSASPEAMNRMKRESGTRDDIRESAMVNELLRPLGVNYMLRGFYFISDFKAPRFNHVLTTDDNLTRVPAETLDADGSSLLPNPAYPQATYEAATVLRPDVCESQVPQPTVPLPADMSFNPQEYTGEYQWLNIRNQTTNPFGDRGRYGARIGSAFKPMLVDRGYIFLFDRTSAVAAE